MMIANVRGEFTKVSGAIAYDAADPSNTTIDASIEVASINTREPQRDAHLKSADFFDVEKFPVLAYHGRHISGQPGEWKVRGDLTIRDITREIELDVEGPTPEAKDPWGNMRIGATATAKLSRKDFGLTWNAALETGGVLVGDDVKITIDIEAIRQS
jgi:polyisoprenoid-binding protein YceI